MRFIRVASKGVYADEGPIDQVGQAGKQKPCNLAISATRRRYPNENAAPEDGV
jgi:hypothetical protein